MNNDVEHDGRRNVVILFGVGVVALALVGAMFWLMSAPPTPQLTANATTRQSATPSPTGTPIPSRSTTEATPPPAPSWSNAATPSLPPPEQPTMTAPVPGQTADPDPNAPPPPAPTSVAPAAAPAVSGVNLGCTMSNKRVVAQLTFTTTTKVPVVVRAGDSTDNRNAGPGAVTVKTEGKGLPFCLAVVAGQPVGPVPAG